MSHRDREDSHMLIAMPYHGPEHHLEFPHPRRLIWTALWNMSESVGLPFGGWIVVTEVAGRPPGLLAGLGGVWLLIAIRKVATGSVSALLWISAIVLTLQTAFALFISH